MQNESKDIREIINDISGIIKKSSMNESYVFGQKTPEQRPIQKTSMTPASKQLSNEVEEPTLDSQLNGDTIEASSDGIESKIKQIRTLAIETLVDLDPTGNPDSYKMIKSIWDSCDKYLIKDTAAVKSKEQPENNL